MKKKALFALRVCGWLIIALVTLEVCARIEDKIRYGAPFFASYSIENLYQYDSLGKYGRPNASYLKWHLNGLGYRGPELRTGTYRIACIGASETFGQFESHGNEWPRQLESILNQRAGDQHYEVVNVSYMGMSLATTVKRFPQILSTVQPRIAVIYPSYTPYIEINHPFDPKSPLPRLTPAQSKAQHFELRLSDRVQTFMKTVLPETLQHWLRAGQTKHDTLAANAMDSLPEQNVQAFKSDLDTLTRQFLANGVQVILVTHANRFGSKLNPADAPYLVDWRKFYPSLKEQGLLDMEHRMSESVRQIGASRSVPVVDAATLIAPGGGNFAEFVHFNDAGAHALATIVADQINRDASTSAANIHITHQ